MGECINPETDKPVHMGKLIEENQQLKKRLARLEQEKALLKKAATYFAKELEWSMVLSESRQNNLHKQLK